MPHCGYLVTKINPCDNIDDYGNYFGEIMGGGNYYYQLMYETGLHEKIRAGKPVYKHPKPWARQASPQNSFGSEVEIVTEPGKP